LQGDPVGFGNQMVVHPQFSLITNVDRFSAMTVNDRERGYYQLDQQKENRLHDALSPGYREMSRVQDRRPGAVGSGWLA
jgi:hypothetical protein